MKRSTLQLIEDRELTLFLQSCKVFEGKAMRDRMGSDKDQMNIYKVRG